jgi:hypothetical protein
MNAGDSTLPATEGESMVRTFRGVLLLLGLTAGSLGVGRALADDKPCLIATKGDSPVAQACAKGGLIDAKRVMRDLVKQGKKAGQKFECDDCHKNDTGYDLTPQARDKFKTLLGAIDIKK